MAGFREFLMRGNVVDLAVAVVVGAAFGTLAEALTKDLLTPLIAAIVGKPDFSAIQFTVNNSKFLVGDFINAVIAFVLVAMAVYYFVVVPMSRLLPVNAAPAPPPPPPTKSCPECLSEIPLQARRCGHCTSQIA